MIVRPAKEFLATCVATLSRAVALPMLIEKATLEMKNALSIKTSHTNTSIAMSGRSRFKSYPPMIPSKLARLARRKPL